MPSERLYAALLLGSLIEPARRVTTWLVAPDGPPPLELSLLASALATTADQLVKVEERDAGGGAL